MGIDELDHSTQVVEAVKVIPALGMTKAREQRLLIPRSKLQAIHDYGMHSYSMIWVDTVAGCSTPPMASVRGRGRRGTQSARVRRTVALPASR